MKRTVLSALENQVEESIKRREAYIQTMSDDLFMYFLESVHYEGKKYYIIGITLGSPKMNMNEFRVELEETPMFVLVKDLDVNNMIMLPVKDVIRMKSKGK